MKTDSISNQLRWVILLLAAAVILPTICLLWFMNQAVKNERLAIRQKLIDVYTAKLEPLFLKYSGDYWTHAEKQLYQSADTYKDTLWLLPENYLSQHKEYSAFVILDTSGQTIYPLGPTPTPDNVPLRDLQPAWKLEYSDKDYEQAVREYERISKISSIAAISTYNSKLDMVRVLRKQGQFSEAIKICLDLAYPPEKDYSECTPEKINAVRLMLIGLYDESKDDRLYDELCRQLKNTTLTGDPNFIPLVKLPTETRVFTLGKLIEIASKNNLAEKLSAEIQAAEKLIQSEQIAIEASDILASNTASNDWPAKTFKTISVSPPLYCIKYPTTEGMIIGLVNAETMSDFWKKAATEFEDEMVFCRILDDTGQIIAGQPRIYVGAELSFGQTFFEHDLGAFFPDWKVEFYFRYGGFAVAAKRQQFTYFWIAALMILLVLLAGGGAIRMIGKQAKMNRLKNDFIATITHELKTPLSSMRLLVDTLLEKRYDNETTATEYLQLVANENKRLTHLIDSFLTFSRMERNKQVFDFQPVSPKEITAAAAEAMQAKFNKKNCTFSVTISDNLPSISIDKDAMVTVLVNLLDNAYKYTNTDKQIELKVYEQNGYVCFVVKDNGIGISRRVQKRIFNRFYQVDSRLSRSVEGCGLGLSIVKFIVDAHKGKIEVESQPGQGSTFTVKLPASNGTRAWSPR